MKKDKKLSMSQRQGHFIFYIFFSTRKKQDESLQSKEGRCSGRRNWAEKEREMNVRERWRQRKITSGSMSQTGSSREKVSIRPRLGSPSRWVSRGWCYKETLAFSREPCPKLKTPSGAHQLLEMRKLAFKTEEEKMFSRDWRRAPLPVFLVPSVLVRVNSIKSWPREPSRW